MLTICHTLQWINLSVLHLPTTIKECCTCVPLPSLCLESLSSVEGSDSESSSAAINHSIPHKLQAKSYQRRLIRENRVATQIVRCTYTYSYTPPVFGTSSVHE